MVTRGTGGGTVAGRARPGGGGGSVPLARLRVGPGVRSRTGAVTDAGRCRGGSAVVAAATCDGRTGALPATVAASSSFCPQPASAGWCALGR